MSVTLAAYQDILYCSRPVSRHPKMSIENRAKLLSALLYTAASAVAVTLSILLVLLPIADWSGFWGDLGELLSSITE